MLVRLRGLLGDFELYPRSLAPSGPRSNFDHSLLTRMLRSAVAELSEYQLRALLHESEDSERRLDQTGLIDRLAWMIARGDLILVREVHGTATPDVPEGPEKPEEPEDIERLTWIEVLIEDEEQQPVANVAYRLILPDGSVRTGKTNRAGIARYEQIPDGECQFELTELDAEAWEIV
jgi:hypothetical protein